MFLTINEKGQRLRNIYEKNLCVQQKKFKIIILSQKGEHFDTIPGVQKRQADISAKTPVGGLWKSKILQKAVTGPYAPEMRASRYRGKIALIP